MTPEQQQQILRARGLCGALNQARDSICIQGRAEPHVCFEDVASKVPCCNDMHHRVDTKTLQCKHCGAQFREVPR